MAANWVVKSAEEARTVDPKVEEETTVKVQMGAEAAAVEKVGIRVEQTEVASLGDSARQAIR